MCMIKFISVPSHALDPLPCETVTPSRTPSPLERDVLYGRPPNRVKIRKSEKPGRWLKKSHQKFWAWKWTFVPKKTSFRNLGPRQNFPPPQTRRQVSATSLTPSFGRESPPTLCFVCDTLIGGMKSIKRRRSLSLSHKGAYQLKDVVSYKWNFWHPSHMSLLVRPLPKKNIP